MIEALFQYVFLQNAVLSAVLVSIVCGIMGAIIIEKKLVMMSGGIAHVAFGGVGLGFFLNITPMLGALVFSLLAALGITAIKSKANTDADVLIGIFWSVGMALGVLFIAFTPGYPPEMSSYLFGDILMVSRLDLKIMTVLTASIILIIAAFLHPLKSFLFDEEFAAVSGVNTKALEYLLFVLIALTVVVLIRVVGIILIIALLVIPPAVVKQFTYNLQKIMLFSVLLGMFFCFSGLWVSYQLYIASGATIILVSALTYLVVSVAKWRKADGSKTSKSVSQ